MRKVLSAVLGVAMLITSAVIGITASADDSYYTRNTHAQFYVQRGGIQMDEYGSISSQPTSYFTPMVYEDELTAGIRSADYTVVYREGSVSSDDVIAEIVNKPDDAEIFAEIKAEYENKGYILTSSGNVVDWDNFTTDNYKMLWYVLKAEDVASWNPVWHVDGIIIEIETNDPVEIPSEGDDDYVPPEELPTPEPEPEPSTEPEDPQTPSIDAGDGYQSNFAYIFGHSDTVMGAEDNLLRSEISAMIHRLVKQNNKLGGFVYDESAEPVFADIAGEWFRSGIEYMAYKDALTGDESNNVYPYGAVTRGEAFKLICIGLGFTDNVDLTYMDYAQALKDAGYVIGDENGNLNVDNLINRAEFCAIYNRIIGRQTAPLVTADGTPVTAETYGFTDLDEGEWYYGTMLRATSAYNSDGVVDLELRAVRNDLDDYK